MQFLEQILLKKGAEGGEVGAAVQPVINEFFKIGGIVFPVVLGVGAILIIIRLIWLGVKLAQSSDDPERRSKIIKGMIWWGVGLVIVIAATVVSGVVFHSIVPEPQS